MTVIELNQADPSPSLLREQHEEAQRLALEQWLEREREQWAAWEHQEPEPEFVI